MSMKTSPIEPREELSGVNRTAKVTAAAVSMVNNIERSEPSEGLSGISQAEKIMAGPNIDMVPVQESIRAEGTREIEGKEQKHNDDEEHNDDDDEDTENGEEGKKDDKIQEQDKEEEMKEKSRKRKKQKLRKVEISRDSCEQVEEVDSEELKEPEQDERQELGIVKIQSKDRRSIETQTVEPQVGDSNQQQQQQQHKPPQNKHGKQEQQEIQLPQQLDEPQKQGEQRNSQQTLQGQEVQAQMEHNRAEIKDTSVQAQERREQLQEPFLPPVTQIFLPSRTSHDINTMRLSSDFSLRNPRSHHPHVYEHLDNLSRLQPELVTFQRSTEGQGFTDSGLPQHFSPSGYEQQLTIDHYICTQHQQQQWQRQQPNSERLPSVNAIATGSEPPASSLHPCDVPLLEHQSSMGSIYAPLSSSTSAYMVRHSNFQPIETDPLASVYPSGRFLPPQNQGSNLNFDFYTNQNNEIISNHHVYVHHHFHHHHHHHVGDDYNNDEIINMTNTCENNIYHLEEMNRFITTPGQATLLPQRPLAVYQSNSNPGQSHSAMIRNTDDDNSIHEDPANNNNNTYNSNSPNNINSSNDENVVDNSTNYHLDEAKQSSSVQCALAQVHNGNNRNISFKKRREQILPAKRPLRIGSEDQMLEDPLYSHQNLKSVISFRKRMKYFTNNRVPCSNSADSVAHFIEQVQNILQDVASKPSLMNGSASFLRDRFRTLSIKMTAEAEKQVFFEELENNILKIPENGFNMLPEELCKHIFSFLEGKELAKMKTVCKRWNQYGNDECIWKQLCLERCQSLLTDKALWGLITSTVSYDDPFKWRKIFPHFADRQRWQCRLQKTGRFICKLVAHHIAGSLLVENELPYTLIVERRFNILHLQSFVLPGASLVYFEPETEEDRPGFEEFIEYLSRRTRAGLALDDQRRFIFIPPCEYSKNVNYFGSSLLGVVQSAYPPLAS